MGNGNRMVICSSHVYMHAQSHTHTHTHTNKHKQLASVFWEGVCYQVARIMRKTHSNLYSFTLLIKSPPQVAQALKIQKYQKCIFKMQNFFGVLVHPALKTPRKEAIFFETAQIHAYIYYQIDYI